jgi:crotonobetainyl-CoA:carnitine CoA-transferase CaiB-like acyl-CoA transferase
VIKIEHPIKGDSLRGHGPSKDGVPLWWSMVGRNKRCVALNLGDPDGAEVFLQLVEQADIVVENFRPGTLERWGVGYKEMTAVNPHVQLVRVTGFGQTGPYASRPAFGTLAEAMSGFAAMTGEPDGPPTLPPFGLADGIAGIATALAAVMALQGRSRSVGADAGTAQEIDLAILEPLVTVLGSQPIAYDQLGEIPVRRGNRSENNAPRNTYCTADGRWVAVSTSANQIAERVMRLVGRPEVIDEPWFSTGAGRAAHADLLDGAVADWIAQRSTDEVVEAFSEAEAALALVYDISDLMNDPQVVHRDTITTVDDPQLGPVRQQNVLFRMSDTPGSIRFTGRTLGEDTDAVLSELGLSAERLAELRDRDVIR